MGKTKDAKSPASIVASKSKKTKARPAWVQHATSAAVLVAAVGLTTFLASGSPSPTLPAADVRPPPAEEDKHQDCGAWAKAGECKNNPGFMKSECAASCSGSNERDTWHNASECLAWAGSGECESNAAFMDVNCALSCGRIVRSCEEYKARCKRPEGMKPALEPGMMNVTFKRIMDDFGHLEPEMISHDPPVLLFNKFLSDDEADTFIKYGKGKYQKSLGVGIGEDGKMADVKTEIRTSSHTWCQDTECLADSYVKAVVARVSDVTRTPETNGEFAQLVYYKSCPHDGHPDCAFYRRHSDYIEGDVHRVQGVRIYTIFMYLNDVPGGGATQFTDLPSGPVTFNAQRGKAILWPSVLDTSPHTIDPRTHHEAQPVTAGEKFGANFWIHQYDFKGPHHTGCTH